MRASSCHENYITGAGARAAGLYFTRHDAADAKRMHLMSYDFCKLVLFFAIFIAASVGRTLVSVVPTRSQREPAMLHDTSFPCISATRRR